MKDWRDSSWVNNYSYEERVNNTLKYVLLPMLKEYLKMPSKDGRADRQLIRQELSEIIVKIDDLIEQENNEI